jgi:hypothetical protein
MAGLTHRGVQLVDPLLTNLGKKYTPEGFIAEQVFPRVPVSSEAGKYAVWTREDFFRVDTDPMLPDRSETKEIDFTVSTESYSCEEYALRTSVSEREERQAASLGGSRLLRLRETKVQGVRDIIALHREVRVAALLTAAGGLSNSSTPSVNWSHADATIEADILTAKEAVYDDIGRPPNTIIIPWKLANAIAIQPDIREILKYTVDGRQLLALGENVLPAMLWGLKVIVPQVQATTSHEGAGTQTFTDVWGDSARVLYINPTPDTERPSVGYTLQTRGFEVRTWREDDPNVERIRVSDGILEEKLVAPEAGYELIDLLA